jgi:hypothetical protein
MDRGSGSPRFDMLAFAAYSRWSAVRCLLAAASVISGVFFKDNAASIYQAAIKTQRLRWGGNAGGEFACPYPYEHPHTPTIATFPGHLSDRCGKFAERAQA